MKRLNGLCVPVLSLALVLAGCGKESDALPVDGREFDGVDYSEPAPYTGRVIDGYLRNARVWLDIDGDSQVTPGPLVVTLANGREITLTSGEPTTMSGPGGLFSLDVSELVLPPGVGPDLDPRDYPLFALAMPGSTLEETDAGEVPVARGYLMSAAPGVRNVTPLTTVDRYRRLVGLASVADDPAGAALADLNLVRDYILAGDDRAHAYARALARFMASQLPDGYNTLLEQPDSDGTEPFLSRQGAFLLGVSLVQNAGEVAALVDDAASGNYASVNVDSLGLPRVALDLDDPVLLTRQTVYAEPASTGELPASASGLEVSAELVFSYTADGRLRSIEAQGCLAPSMPELARLTGVNGRMGELATQWLPSVSLSPQSRVHYEAEGVDERLVFDWESNTIRFDTVTSCHLHDGAVPESSELGGTAEIVYTWTLAGGELASLVARYSDGSERTLTPQGDHATGALSGYRIQQGASEREALSLASAMVTCQASEEPAEADQVVTGQQAYTFAGYDPQPVGFTDLMLEFDARGLVAGRADAPRLLSYGFIDPVLAAQERVTGDGSFLWAMAYPAEGEPGYVTDQPNLIEQAYLRSYQAAGQCGREFDAPVNSIFARVAYDYQRLSAYLVGRLVP